MTYKNSAINQRKKEKTLRKYIIDSALILAAVGAIGYGGYTLFNKANTQVNLEQSKLEQTLNKETTEDNKLRELTGGYNPYSRD